MTMAKSHDGLGQSARRARYLLSLTKIGQEYSFPELGQLMYGGLTPGVPMRQRTALSKLINALVESRNFEVVRHSVWRRIERVKP